MPNKEELEIFVATHKQFSQKLPECYKPLLVGSHNKENITEYIRDDTGDNISAKNPSYCELTGVYWIWKNVNSEYVGLCHYRRYFCKGYGKILEKKDIMKYLNSNDIIVPKAFYTKESVYEYFKEKHNIKDLDNCKKIIKKIYPEYSDSFDEVMNSNEVFICNMLITKKENFDSYCKWLFTIMNELEKITDLSKYDDYQKRLYGFLSERLFSVWIKKNNLKVKECEMWISESTRVQHIKRYLNDTKKKMLYGQN